MFQLICDADTANRSKVMLLGIAQHMPAVGAGSRYASEFIVSWSGRA
jgi:hypothetical protein